MQFEILEQYWYRPSWHPMTIALLPFSFLFGILAATRRCLYQMGMIKKYHFSVPVIVVGNITVGGTGKTPFVIWLAQWLQARGYRPGIVSRGMGGKKQWKPHRVERHDQAQDVGDEAVLIRQQTDCPLVICVDRVAAVRELLQYAQCDIVISDDGLQHYRLGRDLEIALVDAVRGFGNQCLLPAGPLREPTTRLKKVDLVVMNGGTSTDDYVMSLTPMQLISIPSPQKKINLSDMTHTITPRNDGDPIKVHAVAGIGHPERFFTVLRQAGLQLIPHPFPDHYLYQQKDLDFADTLPIIMTEKDAVKCRSFADERYWYLSIRTDINAKLEQTLSSWLEDSHNEYKNGFTKPACHPTDQFQCNRTRRQYDESNI